MSAKSNIFWTKPFPNPAPPTQQMTSSPHRMADNSIISKHCLRNRLSLLFIKHCSLFKSNRNYIRCSFLIVLNQSSSVHEHTKEIVSSMAKSNTKRKAPWEICLCINTTLSLQLEKKCQASGEERKSTCADFTCTNKMQGVAKLGKGRERRMNMKQRCWYYLSRALHNQIGPQPHPNGGAISHHI